MKFAAVMIALLLPSLAVEIASIAVASAQPADRGQKFNKIYRCIAKEAVTGQDDGTLGGRDFSRRAHRDFFSAFMIDTLTGAVSYSIEGRDREIWNIVQKGTDENDHVLTFRFVNRNYDNAEKDGLLTHLADATMRFIRVRDWKEKPRVTFMAFDLSTLVSGTCEIVQP
jgi:hypothetical protein